ncbi:52 kDa repressor of the inhibitor of the protein kinase-like, partial [Aphis craccivora]
MSGNICEYLNCGKNKRLNSHFKFHIFPKNDNLCKKWILHLGNYTIKYLKMGTISILKHLDDLSPKSLSKKFICEDHFENDMYMCIKRQRLIPSVVPKLYHNNG